MPPASRVNVHRRGRLQLICTVIFAVLMVLAIAVPVWIEKVSGFSPDGGNGELELWLPIPFGVAAIVCGVFAVRTRRALGG